MRKKIFGTTKKAQSQVGIRQPEMDGYRKCVCGKKVKQNKLDEHLDECANYFASLEKNTIDLNDEIDEL